MAALLHHALLQLHPGAIQAGKHLIYIPQKDLSLPVQMNAVAGSVKQRKPQFLL